MVGLIGANGGTRHFAYIEPPSHRQYVLKLSFSAQPFGIVGVGIGKISIGFLIIRVLRDTRMWQKRVLWVLMAITLINTVTTAIFNFTQCFPPAALWDPALQPMAKCWNPSIQSNYGIFGAAWAAFVDIVLAIMPATIIWKLKLSLQKRLGLWALMGCGIFGAICTAYKAHLLTLLTARADFTWVSDQSSAAPFSQSCAHC